MLPPPPPQLFTLDDLDSAYQWICKIRKEYSDNSDIWNLRRDWNKIKHTLLDQLNDGTYQFSALERYEMDDGAIISLWSSQDMIVLKLITKTLGTMMASHISETCYHIKDHGGLKKAVQQTTAALPEHQFIFRSDIKGYYESIDFKILMTIIKFYIQQPVFLTLIEKAIKRTETRGGVFYDYDERGLPRGSPLSPLLGAIALMPLDQAMGERKDIFYARFQDDWVVLTKSKTALRKVIKITYQVVEGLNLKLHPLKTYIGKISHGFNFLGYYMDDQKILPSQETIRRAHERASVIYDRSPEELPRHRRSSSDRDISEYPVNEAAPSNEMVDEIITSLLDNTFGDPEVSKRIRKYIELWSRWLKSGLSTVSEFTSSVQIHLPSIFSCWIVGGSPHG